MCRSIRTLRPPFTDEVTDDDVRAAALQYVRKIAGMRAPSTANVAAFEAAVDAVAEATRELLGGITVRPSVRAATERSTDGPRTEGPVRVRQPRREETASR